ncbi:MAG: DUF4412 domain-containing protein [Bacteroidales bacterium]
MKKIILSFISVIMIASLSFGQDAKKSSDFFTGIIEYEFSYPESENLDAMIKAQLPNKATAYYGIGQKKSVQVTPSMRMTNIAKDNDNKYEIYLYIDAMGQKMYINRDVEKEDLKESYEDFKVEKFPNEKKTIAGYECFKIVYSSDDVDNVVSYVTEEIQNDIVNDEKPFNYIELYQEVEVNGIKIIFTATNVSKKSLKDKEFKLLNGYQEVPAEMLGL